MPTRREAIIGFIGAAGVMGAAEAWARISYHWRTPASPQTPTGVSDTSGNTGIGEPTTQEPTTKEEIKLDSLLTVTLADKRIRYLTQSSHFTKTPSGFVIAKESREEKIEIFLENSLYRIGDDNEVEGPIKGVEFVGLEPNLWSYSVEGGNFLVPTKPREKRYEVVGVKVDGFGERVTTFTKQLSGAVNTEVYLAFGGVVPGIMTSEHDIQIRNPYKVVDEKVVKMNTSRLIFDLNRVQIAYLYELYFTPTR